MIQLLIATHNKHKIEEIRHLLAGLSFEILSFSDFPSVPQTVEDRSTLEGNALKKAREAWGATGILCLADDTGLECFYLALEPGVLSARFAGEHAAYHDNNRKLLNALKGVPQRRRNAQFRTVIAVAGKGIERSFEGRVTGTILEEPRGSGGFGYDPLFVPRGYEKSYAEMALEEKNSLSHRALALQKTVEYLKTLQ